MTTTLKMVFNLENGKNTTFSLLSPKNELTMTEVTDVGDTMVAKEALIVGDSPITGLKDAYIERYERVELA